MIPPAGRATSGAASLRIAGGRVLTTSGWFDGDVLFEGSRVAAIGGSPGEVGSEVAAVDAGGLLVVPGFLDLQVNGGYGHDFTSRPETVWEVGALLPRQGVTAFLPTIVSSPPGVVSCAIEVLAAGPPPDYRGARPVGLHCEGPMLARGRRGAHRGSQLRSPSMEVIDGWSRSAGVRLVTLAPELPGAEPVIRALTERGTVVSAGHSDASFEQAIHAFDAGVTAGTHLYNAMPAFHHREPGLAGALLGRPDVAAGVIADGVHVHPGAVRAAWRAKGPSGVALVTDSTAALGMGEGSYRLGDARITVAGGTVHDSEGSLAGSVLAMDQAVRNTVAWTGCRPADAIAAASSTPARMIAEAGRGRIEAGAEADVALLTPDLRVVMTIVGGRVAFDSREDGAG